MGSGSILVLHASQAIAERLRSCLVPAGYMLRYQSARELLESEINRIESRLLLLEDCPPDLDGVGLVQRIRPRFADLPIVIISPKNSVPRAVAAVQAGADDFLSLSAEDEVLLAAVEKALVIGTPGPPAAERRSADAIIFQSKMMSHLLTTAERIAASPATVTIQGESGTGKELLARFIHSRSGRSGRPFIAMNCAALPENLAESELFGYERGAFTGADQRKPGKFEQAHGGTLLLDEIGEMALTLQAKLLRALQEKQIDRIGGRKSLAVDVRVIATTNRDLAQMVKEGCFRQDLYYRLRVIPLQIPPLRQRLEDIPVLIDHFIDKYSQAGGVQPRFSKEALQQLRAWQWPGNVRELENVVARAVLIRDADEIGPQHLFLETGLAAPLAQPEGLVGMTVKDLEKKLIIETLAHVDQNRTQAARMLGISIRTLRNKLNEYRDACDLLPRAAGGR